MTRVARLNRFGLSSALCLLVAASAQAQVSATVRMTADRAQIGVGENVRVEIRAEVTGAPNIQVQLPDFSPFQVVARQPHMQSHSMSSGPGGLTRQRATQVQGVILRASQPGSFTIPPARLFAGGQTFDSEPLTIVVGQGGTPGFPPNQPLQQPGTGTLPPDNLDGAEFDDQGFVRTVVDHGRPYVGQQVTATVYLYLRRPLRTNPAVTQEATTDGFWVRDLLPPSRPFEATIATERGIQFRVYVLRRFAAFPLREGELTIGPVSVSMSTGDMWDVFRGTATPLTRSSPPLTVQVRPLPADNRPDGEIHVGRLTVSAELDRDQVATGDAVSLTVRVSGSGTISQIRLPDPEAERLRVLSPEMRDEVNTPGDVVSGTRTFRWLIIPERAGSYELGPFTIHTFDPATEQYNAATSSALTLVAAGNPISTDSEPESPEEQSEPSREDSLRFGPVRHQSELNRDHRSLLDSPAYGWSLLGGPLIFLLALGVRLLRSRRGRQEQDLPSPQRARKLAKKKLGEARQHMNANEPSKFYSAISAALREGLEGKLGSAIGGLTLHELSRELNERGMERALCDRLIEELEGCDFARFSAAGSSQDEMELCFGRTRAILGELESFTPSQEES